jgi:DHA2 family methylenomycin A resistance protein-like MFS transporter
MGGALLVPGSLAIISTSFPKEERGQAIGVWSGFTSITAAIGPVMGGWLIEHVSWRAVFFINVPIVALALLGLLVIPRTPRRPAHLDLPGQLTAAFALAGITYGVIEGGRAGFGTAPVIAALVGGSIEAALFVIIELGVERPAVPLRLLGTGAAVGTIAVGVACFFSFYGVIFTLSLYFQRVLEHGPAVSGLLFLPMTVLCTVATLRVAHWLQRAGVWVPMSVGLLVFGVGVALLCSLGAHSSAWQIALATLPVGVGSGFVGPTVPMALLATLPREQAGVASGIMNAVRQSAATLGVAVFGALLARHVGFVSGMRLAFAVSAGGLLIALVLVLAFVRPVATAAVPAPATS